jgi:hypothetical protein
MSDRPSPWRAVLETQWKWTRAILLLGAIVSFAIPMLSVISSLGRRGDAGFIMGMQSWSVAYTVTAGGLGLMMGMLAWSSDHRARHVYALSLPIPRWQYALNRFGAGLVLLALPVAALFVSTQVVAHSDYVPAALNAYPVALTIRFTLALLVAYSIFFAISAATARTAGFLLGGIALIVVSSIVLSAAGVRQQIVFRVFDALFSSVGILTVFTGRWMLIDV